MDDSSNSTACPGRSAVHQLVYSSSVLLLIYVPIKPLPVSRRKAVRTPRQLNWQLLPSAFKASHKGYIAFDCNPDNMVKYLVSFCTHACSCCLFDWNHLGSLHAADFWEASVTDSAVALHFARMFGMGALWGTALILHATALHPVTSLLC